MPSTFKGFAFGGSAVRIGGVDGSGPQLCPPSCATGGSVCYLLRCQPLGRPHGSGGFSHGDPHHHSSPFARYCTKYCFLAADCPIRRLPSTSSVVARPGLWTILLQSMNIKAEEFIKKNLKAILPHLLEAKADNQVRNQLSRLYYEFTCG